MSWEERTGRKIGKALSKGCLVSLTGSVLVIALLILIVVFLSS